MFELVDVSVDKARAKIIVVGDVACHALYKGIDALGFDDESKFLFIGDNLGSLSEQDELIFSNQSWVTREAYGEISSQKDNKLIVNFTDNTDVLFLISNLGDDFESDTVKNIAKIARKKNILVIAILTTPFRFEGSVRMSSAELAISEIKIFANAMIIIPNEKLIDHGNDAVLDLFEKSSLKIIQVVRGLSGLINYPGMINVDLRDIRLIMDGVGSAGVGAASGENRARSAIEFAFNDSSLNYDGLNSAKGLLVSIRAGADLSLGEYSEIGSIIEEFASRECVVVVGSIIDSTVSDLQVMVMSLHSNHEIDQYNFKKINIDKIKIIAPENVPDETLAQLIIDLSNVYKSIGGDEFILQDVKDIPPDLGRKRFPTHRAVG